MLILQIGLQPIFFLCNQWALDLEGFIHVESVWVVLDP